MKKNTLLLMAFCAVTTIVAPACEDSEIVVLGETRPVAHIDAPTQVATGQLFDLSAAESRGDRALTTFSWDLDGDGTEDVTGESVSHSYASEGAYLVTLTVTDAQGNSDTERVQIVASEAPDTTAPVADAGENLVVSQFATVTFDASASSDDFGIVSYSWDFDTSNGVGEDATGETATHSYFTTGTFTVQLTVADAAGNTASDEITVTVQSDQEAPVADAGGDRTVAARTSVLFDGSASSDDVGIGSYEWDLDGDGEFDETGVQVRQVFESEGSIEITLRVTDFNGNSDTASFELTISEAVPVSLFVQPDLIDNAKVGDSFPIAVSYRYPDGSTEPLELEPTLSNTDVARWRSNGELEAEEEGIVTATFTDGSLSAELRMRVGDDLVSVSGLSSASAAYSSLDVINEVRTPLTALSAGVTPSDVALTGEAAYVLFGGSPGSDNTRLVVFDRASFTELADCEFSAAGGYALAVRSATEVYVSGIGGKVTRHDPTSCSEESALDLSELDVTNGLARGSDLAVFENVLVIANSGLDASYSYDPASVIFLDVEAGTVIDTLVLPPTCLNAGSVQIDGTELLVGCTGNYADVPAALARVSLRTLEVFGVIAMEAGAAASFALSARDDLVVVGDAFSANVGVIDLSLGVVIREFADGMTLALPGAPALGYDYTPELLIDDSGEVYALSFGDSRLFRFDSLLAAVADEVEPLMTAGASSDGSQFLVPLALEREALALSPDFATIDFPASGEGSANPDNLYGPPAGGGATAPNSDPNALLSLSDGDVVTITLQGVELVDGPGADFVVFENPFYAAGSFFERAIDPARVQVSPDGEVWYDYPAVEDGSRLSGLFSSDARRYLSGFVGVNAVFANPATNDIALGSPAAGGDRFDLAALGLTRARAIRIVDIAGDSRGADLDAVALINWRSN